QEDGSTTYQGAARMMWQWMPNVMVVPVFKVYSYDISSKSTAGGIDKHTLKGWQAGLAGNWALGTNDLFVLGATVARNEEKDDFGPASATDAFKETETFAPQVFAALETHVNSWLTVRFG